MTGQRGGLAGNALHEIPVAAHGVHVEVEQIKLRSIEMRGTPLRSQGHAHTVANALPQGTRRGLDARCLTKFRMARARAVPLTKIADVVQRNGGAIQGVSRCVHLLDTSHVQQGVEQHGGVSAAEHEAVARGPVGSCRVVTQKFVPQRVRHRCQSHRRSRMAAIGSLHTVHGQGADGVNCQLRYLFGALIHGRRHVFPLSLQTLKNGECKTGRLRPGVGRAVLLGWVTVIRRAVGKP